MTALLLIIVILFCIYSVTVGIALGLLFLATALAPRLMSNDGDANLPLLVVNLFVWTLAGTVGGGLIAVLLAPWHPFLIALGFALGLLGIMLSVALQGLGNTSLNYDVTVAAFAAVGTVFGCLLLQMLHLQVHYNF
jgi:hypothetical protein